MEIVEVGRPWDPIVSNRHHASWAVDKDRIMYWFRVEFLRNKDAVTSQNVSNACRQLNFCWFPAVNLRRIFVNCPTTLSSLQNNGLPYRTRQSADHLFCWNEMRWLNFALRSVKDEMITDFMHRFNMCCNRDVCYSPGLDDIFRNELKHKNEWTSSSTDANWYFCGQHHWNWDWDWNCVSLWFFASLSAYLPTMDLQPIWIIMSMEYVVISKTMCTREFNFHFICSDFMKYIWKDVVETYLEWRQSLERSNANM